MAELIECRECNERNCQGCNIHTLATMLHAGKLKSIMSDGYCIDPFAEVQPVRHGRWEECDWVEYDGHGECIHYPHEGCVCTNCRNAFKKEFVINPRVNRCPNCGAKMDKENGDG